MVCSLLSNMQKGFQQKLGAPSPTRGTVIILLIYTKTIGTSPHFLGPQVSYISIVLHHRVMLQAVMGIIADARNFLVPLIDCDDV